MNILKADQEGIAAAVKHIKAGGIVAHATETCYGLTCDPYNPAALALLFNLKQRPIGQPVSVLVSGAKQAATIVDWNQQAKSLSTHYWPGALTIVATATDTHLQVCLDQLPTTIAVRQSSNAIAQALVEAIGTPIVTTSANLHRMPETYDTEAIAYQFNQPTNEVLLVLDSGVIATNAPSTLVDTTTEPVTVLRQGGIIIA